MSVIVPARSRLGVALRDQRLIKPQGLPLRPSKVDWSHPLARGMVGCWVMSQTDGAQFHDLAQFNDGLISGNISKVITDRGPAAYVTNDGTSDRINLGSIGPNNPMYMPNDQVSAFVYTILGGSVTHGSGYPRLIDKSSSGYAAGGWAFYVDFSVNRLEFDWGASNQRATRDLVNLDSTAWTTLSCSVDTTTTTGRVFMQDGIELTSIGANNTGNIPASTTNAALLNWNHSTDRQWREPVACIFVWNRMLTKAEHEELHQKIAPFLVPINNTPFLIDVSAAGGGVSGTGDLVGAGSEITGTGERTVTGTGALEGHGAQVVGTATRTITGTGVLVGQGSDVAGTGAAGGTHTGTGDLVGAGSEIVGVGERTVTGTGALVAQGSAVAGVGERTVTGSGDLVGAGAEVSGSGAIGGITTGTGDLVGAGSEIVGTGLRTVTGSGALVAQGSAVAGTGERTVTGAGALVGSGSEIVGAGVGGDVTTGAGALVGQGSAVTGTGTRTITGVGELVAAGSIIVGSGLRTVTGSGALVGAGSEIVGTYVATIVEPSLFQSAADTIIDVFAAAHGQTITLALDSGTVTITGFMRKRPKDWSTPDGKMRGSGWQIVCKGWEISSSDLEGMSGKRATVDGDAYYIVSATPKTSGTLVLDVGYANA